MKRLIFAAALFGFSAFGQNIFQNTFTRFDGDDITVRFTVSPMLGRASRGVVTGAPYSADQTFEHVQTLADGTHITQKRETQHFARDSQGRTRIERPLIVTPMMNQEKLSAPMLIEIDDRVAGYAYVLDEQNRIAHRVTISSSDQQSQPAARPQVQTTGGGGGTGGVAAAMPVPNRSASRPEMSKPEDLGTDTIEGVMVKGTRTTMTWPVGSQGNDREMVDTNESWFSPDLHLMVLSKHTSAMNGDSINRYTNISRAEPDSSLFQPPAGYTIVDEKDSFEMTLRRQ